MVLPLAILIASPASSKIVPLVVTVAAPLMLNWSLLLPVAPAIKVILPPLDEVTLPLMVSGLWVAIRIAPASELTGPLTVVDPVLSIKILPLLGLVWLTTCTVSAPVLVILIAVSLPLLLALRVATADCKSMPPPAAAVKALPVTSPLPVMAPPAARLTAYPATFTGASSINAPGVTSASAPALAGVMAADTVIAGLVNPLMNPLMLKPPAVI